jgi:glycosyltransferase involved in cell wall biosynthesis
VQEARALAGLGARVRVLVESEFAGRARELYPEAGGLFEFYGSPAELEAALEGFDVVVATEAPSARAVAAYAGARPGVLGAYYVQDYEPLFSPAGGPGADAALLSYRQAGELLLFAKTHWIANVIGAAHDLPVAKVRPSLDRDTFHAAGRSGDPARPRVLAMVRPRTPRRRPAETLAALARLKAELGDGVECLTFGCAAEELAALPPAPGVDHLGLLSRAEVAEVLRRCDLFLDLSTYQAFGRSGLEAMACGAVPILPRRGGVAEYAEHERNAVLVDSEDEDAVIAAATALLSDRERLERLRAAGIETAKNFSLHEAALSQHACFAASHPRRGGSA